MKKSIFILLFALLNILSARAADFEVDGIYYNIISDTRVEVTRFEGDNRYSGSVVIPAAVEYEGTTYTVTSIGENAFGETFVTSVTIPEGVTTIGREAFHYCEELTSVTFPESVDSIGEFAFYGCRLISAPLYNSRIFAFLPVSYSGEYTIPSGIQSIGGGAFSSCYNLRAVTFPESVTSIGDEAFYGCSGLRSVTIPEGIISIGERTFAYCYGLTSITLPESLEIINDGAFYNCVSLVSVTSLATTPPRIVYNDNYEYEGVVFYNYSGTLYVPHGCKAAYEVAQEWYRFFRIEELTSGSDEPGTPTANENLDVDNFGVYVQDRTIYLSENRGSVQVYNVAGQCIYNGHATAISVPQSGVYVVAVGSQRFKVLVR